MPSIISAKSLSDERKSAAPSPTHAGATQRKTNAGTPGYFKKDFGASQKLARFYKKQEEEPRSHSVPPAGSDEDLASTLLARSTSAGNVVAPTTEIVYVNPSAEKANIATAQLAINEFLVSMLRSKVTKFITERIAALGLEKYFIAPIAADVDLVTDDIDIERDEQQPMGVFSHSIPSLDECNDFSPDAADKRLSESRAYPMGLGMFDLVAGLLSQDADSVNNAHRSGNTAVIIDAGLGLCQLLLDNKLTDVDAGHNHLITGHPLSRPISVETLLELAVSKEESYIDPICPNIPFFRKSFVVQNTQWRDVFQQGLSTAQLREINDENNTVSNQYLQELVFGYQMVYELYQREALVLNPMDIAEQLFLANIDHDSINWALTVVDTLNERIEAVACAYNDLRRINPADLSVQPDAPNKPDHRPQVLKLLQKIAASINSHVDRATLSPEDRTTLASAGNLPWAKPLRSSSSPTTCLRQVGIFNVRAVGGRQDMASPTPGHIAPPPSPRTPT